ncbi:hypothetical protein A2697_01255 [Candidatus Curtissbacteria bacterium RIFCSPHIGHO2_01_FULL_41_44]|uniref:Uncharacterized protein n=1 Tax=Candidatus Curtissbacteria bacterium RIFCSPLOWO2_01_FULL_42_50 TaxID=1797730 RepID=A0A1F5H3C1_9BACT|nr:MAG: hypothetical protein A3C33_00470 [Candidatus Curtissbacteria bacterium RIFCSPHIGHO2_02_FULL_42_58]OGD94536.1 MAG: hypothetical protein A2697_01255 [Candidatus Curtissbacteria bacterium RIFCSPHIGHO2_01_FULL_41_44]OGD97921.1 MAG: hypothetical protein A3E71_03730 [Candidatus Curtissbacteria bacterium RIFCSPHIGHO2_12_FULL_42_33]OGD98569.1 MAG: hypothetical protein A3B54_05300 [Candidatus Curtissbacteria bacterium RIFCSPLOWO2_01_FULL_42_50]OGE02145.1 MAG: hypothetical protein A3G16_02155 [Ca
MARHNIKNKVIIGNTSFSFRVEEDLAGAANRLWQRVANEEGIDHSELSEPELVSLRNQAIERVYDILRSERLVEIFDSQDQDTQQILYWFFCQDQEQLSELIKYVLTENPTRRQKTQKRQVTAVWWEWKVPEDLLPRQTQTIEVLRQAPQVVEIAGHPLVLQSTTDASALPEVESGIPQEAPVEETSGALLPLAQPKITEQPRVLTIEKSDSKIREKVNQILDELGASNITLPINGAQLTRIFPRVKAISIQQAIENGYISPERGRGKQHSVFNLREIALLVYLKDRGNGLSKKECKELEDIIEEEIEKKKQK